MATEIAGPVRLPDGTIPAHGKIIFRRKEAQISDGVVLTAPVSANIDGAGDFTITLAAASSGTPYSVIVVYWSAVENRLLSCPLPDVVPTGAAGPVTLAGIAAHVLPDVPSEHRVKRGSTLILPCRLLDKNARPQPLTGLTIASDLRGPDGETRPFTVAVLDSATGDFEVLMTAAQTALLPLGGHAWDIKFSTGARVDRTITGTIIIEQEVTA